MVGGAHGAVAARGRLRWGLVTVAFVGVAAVLLTAAVQDRGTAEITGTLPTRADAQAPARDATSEPDALSDAAALLQQGRVDEARSSIDAVLLRRPDDPDATLLLGIAQRLQGEEDAEATLRRFLELAPDGHPGVRLADDLLDGLP